MQSMNSKPEGLAQLKEDLKKNFSQEKVNTLCVKEGQKVRVTCFQSAGSLSALADKFYIVTQEHPSDLFATEWEAAMNAAVRSSAGAALTLADIHSKVWVPAFHNCQSLLDKLYDRSMKLSCIDGHFKQHEHDLEIQLASLFAGVNACLGKAKSGAWIGEVVHRIYDYWHLHNYRKAANAFLDLKKALNLQKGDFNNVEKIATEVRIECKPDDINMFVGATHSIVDFMKKCACGRGNDAWVSSQITSRKVQLRAPLSPCKQPGPVSTLICIVVGHPVDFIFVQYIGDNLDEGPDT